MEDLGIIVGLGLDLGDVDVKDIQSMTENVEDLIHLLAVARQVTALRALFRVVVTV